jgi:hypothetical protein
MSCANQRSSRKAQTLENEIERTFSIELKLKTQLKNVTLTNGNSENVLIEGTLGELVQATFEDVEIFEVLGTKGVLRINLQEKEIKQCKALQR